MQLERAPQCYATNKLLYACAVMEQHQAQAQARTRRDGVKTHLCQEGDNITLPRLNPLSLFLSLSLSLSLSRLLFSARRGSRLLPHKHSSTHSFSRPPGAFEIV